METFDPSKDTIASPLAFADSAVRKAKALIEMEGKKDLCLRLFVTGGGCTGFQYGFMFDENRQEDDIAVCREGVTLLVDSMSIQYLKGSEVLYTEGLEGARFIVNNPNAKITCGCGSSFAV